MPFSKSERGNTSFDRGPKTREWGILLPGFGTFAVVLVPCLSDDAVFEQDGAGREVIRVLRECRALPSVSGFEAIGYRVRTNSPNKNHRQFS